MQTNYNLQEQKWQIQTTDILPKYDLFFGMPINDVAYGFPIGDGATGSLVWLEKDGVHIHINHVDLWQAGPVQDCFCGTMNNSVSVLRHGAELVIDFGCPCFEHIYQEAFEGRLSLRDASVAVSSKTPFSDISFNGFASSQHQCTAFTVRAQTDFPFTPKIALKRWGSQNFWRWYAIAGNNKLEGLDGTDVYFQDGAVYIVQEFSNLRFCIGLKIVANTPVCFEKKNCHEGEVTFEKGKEHQFSLVYNLSIGETVDKAVRNCKEKIDGFFRVGMEQARTAHIASWERFWNQSYVDISEDYIENIFYLNEYFLNSACRGQYPPHFTSGVWGFYHDFTAWMHYFHYNMQHMYHSLESAGHGDLSKNYYDFRYNTLEKAKEYAQAKFHKNGAFYHDVVDFKGNGYPSDFLNCTPGPQIAMMMYRRYLYSGDREFLQEKALPVMRAVAEFYVNTFVKEGDGLYHIYGTSAYEGHEPTQDTITDITSAKALFGALINHSDGEEKAKYEDILAHLPDYGFCKTSKKEVDNGTYQVGIGKGNSAYSDETVVCGTFQNEQPLHGTYANENRIYYGFPDIEMSLVFPSGEVGIKDRGSRIYNATLNAMLLHSNPNEIDCGNWCMMPIYLARMGIRETVVSFIKDTLNKWQAFPNGFTSDCAGNLQDVFDTNKYYTVLDEYSDKKFVVPAHPFRHFDIETTPIIATATMEMVLQSHGGEIRLFPAIEEERETSFRLHAEGGFVVQAQKNKDGFVATIHKTYQDSCKVIIPEDYNGFFVYDIVDGKYQKQDCAITVRKGDKIAAILFKGDGVLLSNQPLETLVFAPMKAQEKNDDYKTCGKAILGSPNRLKR